MKPSLKKIVQARSYQFFENDMKNENDMKHAEEVELRQNIGSKAS